MPHLCFLVSLLLLCIFGMPQGKWSILLSLFFLVWVDFHSFDSDGVDWACLPASNKTGPRLHGLGEDRTALGKGAALNHCVHAQWSQFHALLPHQSLGYFLWFLLCSLVSWSKFNSRSLALCFKSCSLAPSSVLSCLLTFGFVFSLQYIGVRFSWVLGTKFLLKIRQSLLAWPLQQHGEDLDMQVSRGTREEGPGPLPSLLSALFLDTCIFKVVASC